MSYQIVCLHDGSKGSDAALDKAIEKAKRLQNKSENVEIKIPYIIDRDKPLNVYSIFNFEPDLEKVENSLNKIKEKILNENIQCNYEIIRGPFIQIIQSLKCDEIFIGQDVSYNNNSLIKPYDEFVIKRVDCVVTLIRYNHETHQICGIIKVDLNM